MKMMIGIFQRTCQNSLIPSGLCGTETQREKKQEAAQSPAASVFTMTVLDFNVTLFKKTGLTHAPHLGSYQLLMVIFDIMPSP